MKQAKSLGLNSTTKTLHYQSILVSCLGSLKTSINTLLKPTPGANRNLCSACQSLLVRPFYDPAKGYVSSSSSDHSCEESEERPHIYQPRDIISSSALNGCVICKLVLAVGLRIERAKDVEVWKLVLDWDGDAFRMIQIIPHDRHHGRPHRYGGLTGGIRLVSKGQEGKNNTSYPSNTNSEPCKSTASRWLTDCITNHPKCHEKRNPPDWLPTRLIDLRPTGGALRAQLILSSELTNRNEINYVALTHRWAATSIIKLDTSNIDAFKRDLPLERVPKTFLEAMKATKDLGFRYLWIDSLCILQDSSDDWITESVQMDRVYRNSALNIAATGDSDFGGGLFQERDPDSIMQHHLKLSYSGHEKAYIACIDDLWGKWICRSSLSKRGWVFQERMLSPRTLHFSNQLFWECKQLRACETFPDGGPHNDHHYGELDGRWLRISAKNWREDFNSRYVKEEYWADLVNSYGRCSITDPSDRLIAIAGIAKTLQPIVKDTYLAGLWKSTLPYNLVWVLKDPKGLREPQTFSLRTCRCPSWSWAALDYSSADIKTFSRIDFFEGATFVTVDEANVHPIGSDPFGPLNGGYIRLTGRLGKVSRIRTYSELLRQVGSGVVLDNWDIDESALFSLPLFNTGRFGQSLTLTMSLLLQQLQPGGSEYIRVGVLRVNSSMTLEKFPEDIRWIHEYGRTGVSDKEAVAITIY